MQGSVGVADVLELLAMVPVNCEKFDGDVNILTKKDKNAKIKAFSENTKSKDLTRFNTKENNDHGINPTLISLDAPNNKSAAKKTTALPGFKLPSQKNFIKNTENPKTPKKPRY
jgi:hypothetical protein